MARNLHLIGRPLDNDKRLFVYSCTLENAVPRYIAYLDDFRAAYPLVRFGAEERVGPRRKGSFIPRSGHIPIDPGISSEII